MKQRTPRFCMNANPAHLARPFEEKIWKRGTFVKLISAFQVFAKLTTGFFFPQT